MNEQPRYWRSLEDLAGAPPAGRDLSPEFPEGADLIDGATRRDFLKLLGGTAALSTMAAGCFANPPDKILPYTRQPVELTPGNALHYATSLTLDGYGMGVVVAAREGRPIKVEGNREHPASLGATGSIEQGAIYHLYDPQRARQLRYRKRQHAWVTLLAELAARRQSWRNDAGARLRFLVEPSGSPLEADLRARILAAFPKARFYAWSPVHQDAAYAATHQLFGQPLETRLELDRARVIVSLDADFLIEGPSRVRNARQFADHRVPDNELNRLYVAEARFTVTGAQADHRLRVKSAEIEGLALALLGAVAPERLPAGARAAVGRFADHPWVRAVAKDLKAKPSTALVVAGHRQPASVHAVAAALNAALGTQAVSYAAPTLTDTVAGPSSLSGLAEEIRAGQVDALIITAYNPVYTAPAELGLGELLAKVPCTIYRSLFDDETARHCAWFVPATHELEAWGDSRAFDGSVSLQQPLIQPMYNGITTSQLLAGVLNDDDGSPYRLLQEFWRVRQGGADFDAWWDKSVQRGVIEGSALQPQTVTPRWEALEQALAAVKPAATGGIEINFVADTKIHDGRFADNAWLQELPDPMSKLTWGNAVQISPKTAAKLDIRIEDTVEVTVGAHKISAPALIMPGLADDTVCIALGYGRRGAEMIARELGTNVATLRTTAAPWFAPGVSLAKTGLTTPISLTQEHWSMEGRPLALEVEASDLPRRHLPVVSEQKGEQPSLYPEYDYKGYKWAMAIDLSRCTGCSTCIIACESENNILVVGKDQVRRSREMQWMRIDRYFTGDADNAEAVMQPVACVQCENAPCEYVCPANATMHSDEGLNDMVYNRCVGTRYCSNNCPYKVRRFNYLNWHNNLQGTEEMAMNPDVTVRARGVMEKCTYCVQRIERARIETRVAGTQIKDGDLVTACQQACPSGAIVFGSIHDPKTQVSRQHADRRSYALLHELNTKPRTVHMARVRNRNPELAMAAGSGAHREEAE